jgi:integrase
MGCTYLLDESDPLGLVWFEVVVCGGTNHGGVWRCKGAFASKKSRTIKKMKQPTAISLQDAFDQFIAAVTRGKRKKPNGHSLQPAVIDHYRNTQKNIAQFEKHTHKTYHIQFVHSSSVRRWQQEKRYWKGFLENYLRYGRTTMHWSDTYLDHSLKALKAVFNYLANARGLPVGNFQKDFAVQAWQAPPLVIMPQRLQWLINNETFQKSLPPCLEKVLDTMIIGCTVGLRFQDLMALRPSSLETIGGHAYLATHTSKTGTPVRIPLPPYAVSILHKYYRKTNKRLLPQLCNNQFNNQMKAIGKLAGWTEDTPKYRSVKGRQTEIKNKNGKTWKYYEHLSAHTMRRTAITTLLLMGVEESVVRTLSGHAPGSKEFYRYVAFVQGYLDKQVKRAHQLLMENPTCFMD